MTNEQRDIQKAVSDFARGEFSSEIAQDLDQKEEFPWQIYQKACELGFVGIHYTYLRVISLFDIIFN